MAWVCERLETLRQDLGRGGHPDQQGDGDPEPLRLVLEAFTAGANLAEPLEDLHTALLDVGDPLGLWGQVRSGHRGVNLAGTHDGTPFEPVYPCPLGRCSGRTPDNTTVFPLVCAITGRELRQKTL